MLDTVEAMTPTQAIFQCPGSLLKKFLNLRLRIPRQWKLDTVKAMTLSRAGIQCPGSLLKTFLDLRFR